MRDHPLIKFALFFAVGIVSIRLINVDQLILIICLGILIFISAALLFTKFEFKHVLQAWMLSLTVIIIGHVYAGFFESKNDRYPFHSEKISDAVVKGEIVDIKLPQDDSFSFILKIDSIMTEGKVFRVSTKLLCKFNVESDTVKTYLLNELHIGNQIVTAGDIYKPRNKRNPGEFDYREYLLTKNITATMNISDAKIILVDDQTNIFDDLIYKARLVIDKKIHQFHSAEAAALLRGLLLADRSEIDFDTRENFVNAGVVHVLAVSGLHVGYIVIIFMVIASRFNLYIRSLVTIIGLLGFLVITGSPPSVFRASVMAIVFIIAQLSNRSTFGLNSLALAGLIILLLNPLEIFSAGFQLSFSAVISILIIYPKISRQILKFNLNKHLQWIIMFIGVSLSAQIGTLPFTLYYFHKLSLIALAANIIVIPMIGLIVAIGFITLGVSLISSWLAFIFASTNNILVLVLNYLVTISGGLGFSHIYIPNFSLYDSIVFYLFIGFAFTLWKRMQTLKARIIFCILIPASMLAYFNLDNKDLIPEGYLSVMVIDIGQGDAILIKFPNGKTALIDAGNKTDSFDNGERVIKPLLNNLGIEKIDYGFISHVDADHYKGFIYLISNDLIEHIYKPRTDTSLNKEKVLQELITSHLLPYDDYCEDTVNIDNCRLYMLNDTTDIRYSSFDSNDRSGVIKLVYGQTSFLFLGDAGLETEEMLMEKYTKLLESDVIKLGHHGSKTSSGFNFLKTVNAKDALISAGIANRFDHPSKEVLEKIKILDMKVHRTDEEGALIFRSNGSTIQKINWKMFE